MTTLTDTAVTGPLTAERDEAPTSATLPVQREVDRLAANLLANISGAHPRCLLMMDVGEAGRSSLWLATSVASTLSETLRVNVHVLSMDREAPGSPSSIRSAEKQGCTLEYIDPASSDRSGRGTLADRLSSLRVTNRPAIIHLAKDRELADLLPNGRAIDGVVLLVRASHTRRAALQAIVRQLAIAEVSLLGCVLLDRIHPIPEKLYKFL